jgi:hypothetical protein
VLSAVIIVPPTSDHLLIGIVSGLTRPQPAANNVVSLSKLMTMIMIPLFGCVSSSRWGFFWDGGLQADPMWSPARGAIISFFLLITNLRQEEKDEERWKHFFQEIKRGGISWGKKKKQAGGHAFNLSSRQTHTTRKAPGRRGQTTSCARHIKSFTKRSRDFRTPLAHPPVSVASAPRINPTDWPPHFIFH